MNTRVLHGCASRIRCVHTANCKQLPTKASPSPSVRLGVPRTCPDDALDSCSCWSSMHQLTCTEAVTQTTADTTKRSHSRYEQHAGARRRYLHNTSRPHAHMPGTIVMPMLTHEGARLSAGKAAISTTASIAAYVTACHRQSCSMRRSLMTQLWRNCKR